MGRSRSGIYVRLKSQDSYSQLPVYGPNVQRLPQTVHSMALSHVLESIRSWSHHQVTFCVFDKVVVQIYTLLKFSGNEHASGQSLTGSDWSTMYMWLHAPAESRPRRHSISHWQKLWVDWNEATRTRDRSANDWVLAQMCVIGLVRRSMSLVLWLHATLHLYRDGKQCTLPAPKTVTSRLQYLDKTCCYSLHVTDTNTNRFNFVPTTYSEVVAVPVSSSCLCGFSWARSVCTDRPGPTMLCRVRAWVCSYVIMHTIIHQRLKFSK